jgi:hypothetical protein
MQRGNRKKEKGEEKEFFFHSCLSTISLATMLSRQEFVLELLCGFASQREQNFCENPLIGF